MLFERERHETLEAKPWSESRAREAIARIFEATLEDFTVDGMWPVHPLDVRDASEPLRMLYFGAAGIMWGVDYLCRAEASAPLPDFAEARAGLLEANRDTLHRFTSDTGSLLMGDAGILLIEWKQSRSERVAARLVTAISETEAHPSLELMWGSPGTMIAALAMHEWTGEERWERLFRRSAAALQRTLEYDLEYDSLLWTQDLFGACFKRIGAVHGFAGNALPLIRGRGLLPEEEWNRWRRCIAKTIEATATREDGLVNWPRSVHDPRPGRTAFLVQHCHGAPGMVNCLAGFPDSGVDELLVEAGELTWVAGPLIKGAGLCHGTAGNGYAFLKLLHRTQDEIWLERARAFAMHAIGQSDRHLQRFGRYRHSLWTGDIGLAIYLWSCVNEAAEFPTMDVF